MLYPVLACWHILSGGLDDSCVCGLGVCGFAGVCKFSDKVWVSCIVMLSGLLCYAFREGRRDVLKELLPK